MDEGAFQGIFQPAPSFFPDNHACQEARKGDKEREEFSKSKKLCYKNVLPEYFYEPRGGSGNRGSGDLRKQTESREVN